MKRLLVFLIPILLLPALIAAACYPAAPLTEAPTEQGRILVWHSHTEAETTAINEVLDRFSDLNPNITIRRRVFPNLDELLDSYIRSTNTGLGPDLLIGPSSWIRQLADGGSIVPIETTIPPETVGRWLPTAIDMVQYNEHLYGLPKSLNTLVLYYNLALVESPPASLSGLLAAATEGNLVLMSTTFRDAFWGIPAFGGDLFDSDGRVILNQGGFINWLDWLRTARNAEGMIFENNREVLRNRFLVGDAAYYIGYASELTTIIEALGESSIRVAPLPSGPNGNAGPFLDLQTVMFSNVSSDRQHRAAFQLGLFLTNAEQSATLMRRVRHVPANVQVRINARLNPNVAAVAAQARTAVPLRNVPQLDTVLRLGNDAYIRVLEGGEPPAEVAFAITQAINEAIGFGPGEQTATVGCSQAGSLRVLHPWADDTAVALQEIAERFRELCPLIYVDLQYDTFSNIQLRMASGAPSGTRPDLVLGPDRWLPALLDSPDLLLNISDKVSTETVQRFRPSALDALRYGHGLYGLPLAVRVKALYYNRALVSAPVLAVDDFRLQATAGVPIILDTRFERALWGIGAFGGRLFDEEYRAIIHYGGFDEWLAWLRASRDHYAIPLSDNGDELRSLFETGQIAYYVGGPEELQTLMTALGENLGVTLLPSGPGGDAVPELEVTAFYFSGAASPSQVALAMEFVQFATHIESQILLAELAADVPANAMVALTDNANIQAFIEQSRSAILIPDVPEMDAFMRYLPLAFDAVLLNNEDPQGAVFRVAQRINAANQLEMILPTPTPLAVPAPTPSREEIEEAAAEEDLNGDDANSSNGPGDTNHAGE
jgi:maltose-binding protein MalE